ncbi:hypothetical protein F4055_02110 [Candidatus Poribacteria bacterium]|nr:hypothetical protein [Candidatus Poribacteria bacterium]
MQEAPLITKITESQKSQFRQLPFISPRSDPVAAPSKNPLLLVAVRSPALQARAGDRQAQTPDRV